MSIVSENIKHLRKLNGWTQGEFAEKIDIKRSLVGAYEEGRADPRLNNLTKMAKLFGLSVDQLITDDLTKFGFEQLKQLGAPQQQGTKILSITVDAQDEEMIDLIPQKASAGYLNGYADPTYMEELPKFQLPNLPRNATYRAFEISGDSMLPLKPGTVIIGKYIEQISDVRNGRCYVLLTKEEGIVYKRVFNYTEENGYLFLVSDNKAYTPYKVNAQDVLEIWEATAFLSLDIPEHANDQMSFDDLKNIVLELQQEVIKLKD